MSRGTLDPTSRGLALGVLPSEGRDLILAGSIITILLLVNVIIDFRQEAKALSALKMLKEKLARTALVLRDGKWSEIPARELVRGDIVKLRIGNVVPADVKLVEGDYLQADQSALTGESLPVSKKPGEVAYSGSSAKQGEMIALVIATGGDTFFGRTARLVEGGHSSTITSTGEPTMTSQEKSGALDHLVAAYEKMLERPLINQPVGG